MQLRKCGNHHIWIFKPGHLYSLVQRQGIEPRESTWTVANARTGSCSGGARFGRYFFVFYAVPPSADRTSAVSVAIKVVYCESVYGLA